MSWTHCGYGLANLLVWLAHCLLVCPELTFIVPGQHEGLQQGLRGLTPRCKAAHGTPNFSYRRLTVFVKCSGLGEFAVGLQPKMLTVAYDVVNRVQRVKGLGQCLDYNWVVL